MKNWFDSQKEEVRIFLAMFLVTIVCSFILNIIPLSGLILVKDFIMCSVLVLSFLLFTWHYLIGSSGFLSPVYLVMYRVTNAVRFKQLYDFHKDNKL